MTSSLGDINLVSYNCRGWNSGQVAVHDLLLSNDICLIQEHWLLQDQLNLLSIDPNFLFVGVSGMDNSKLLIGRPYGGCAILYRRSLLFCTSHVNSTSKRFCSILLHDNLGATTLIVCVYLPFNDGSILSSNEFLITLGELEGFIDRHSPDNVIIAGDFNVDFSRSTTNCQHLLKFMNDLELVPADQISVSGVSYTYMRDDGQACSWPDHFLCSRRSASHFSNFRCLDSGSNLSDHSPLACSYSIDLKSPPTPSCTHSFNSSKQCIAWHKATSDNISDYCDKVSICMPQLSDSIVSCCNPCCTSHHSCMDKFCADLLCCLHDSALKTFPIVRPYGSIPGWTSSAQRFKEKANLWHKVWKQAGSPSAGVLHQLKRSSRARYKYEVRRLRRREHHIRRDRMAVALASSNSKTFWQQVKCVNRCKKPSSSCSIDGHSGAESISRHFSSKLKGILTSQDVNERNSLLSDLSLSLKSSDLQSVIISEECVNDAFHHLKCGKSDGSLLMSDHLIHALPMVRSSLAGLFTAIIRHGYMPAPIRNCVLVPIPKTSKDPTISDNYRAIALASTLSKALEWCILLAYKDWFKTSELQFGFKSKMSTSLCTGLLKCVVSRFLHEGSPVFACFLDASKAFDLVNHSILFQRLLEKGFPGYLVRFLLSWYKEQHMCVRWGNKLSDSFAVSNGVRQGGVLSPVLFTIYIDDLLMNLKSLGVGCYWDGLFTGAVCYADDLALLAPSPSALRIMIRCCEDFAGCRGLRFNPSKTQLIRFSNSQSSNCHAHIFFCGQLLPFVDSVTHLGHVLNYNLSDTPDITCKLRDMVRKANYVLATFPFVGPHILTKLFQSYCLSLYGSCLWSLSCPALLGIEVAFNNILRKLWHLPRRTHTGIVHSVANLISLFNVICHRSYRLLISALNSPSLIVKLIFAESSFHCFCFCGYNYLFGDRHIKDYNAQHISISSVIRCIRCRRNSNPQACKDEEELIHCLCCN